MSNKTSSITLLQSLYAERKQQYQDIVFLLMIRCTLLALQLLSNVLIARFLGAQILGAVQVYATYTATIGEASLIGKPTNIIRQLGKSNQNATSASSVLNFVLHSILWCVAVACVVSIIIFSLRSAFPVVNEKLHFFSITMLGGLLGYILLRCSSEALKAINRQKVAFCLEVGLIPVVLTIGIMFVSTYMTTYIIHLYAIGFITAGVTGVYIFSRLSTQYFHGTQIINASLHDQWQSLWLNGLLGIIYSQFALLALPYFCSLDALGINSAALRYNTITTTFLIVLASYFSPKFAQAQNNKQLLLKLLKQSQLVSIGLFSPLAFIFIVFPEYMLQIFGDEYIAAKHTLQLLTIAQFVNAATGLPGICLIMSGRARLEKNILLVCLAAASLACLWVGSYNNGQGVIIVFCTLIMAKNIISLAYTLKELKHKTK